MGLGEVFSFPAFPKAQFKKAAYLPKGRLCKIGKMLIMLQSKVAVRKANVISGSFSEEVIYSKEMMLYQKSLKVSLLCISKKVHLCVMSPLLKSR